MCSYNRVDGDYACENKYLLTDLLKKDWNFKGFVLSDWGGAHSVAKASAAGLDHEEPGWIFYGEDLKKAVESGKVPQAEAGRSCASHSARDVCHRSDRRSAGEKRGRRSRRP